MTGSDGLPHDEFPHPRLRGTLPRILGHFSRDRSLFSLETAVHKMTGLTVPEFGYVDRGVIREGAHEEITLFDPASVHDRRTRLRGSERASYAALVGDAGQFAVGAGRGADAVDLSAGLGARAEGWPCHRGDDGRRRATSAKRCGGAARDLEPRSWRRARFSSLAQVGLMTAALVCAAILFNRVTGRLWSRRSRAGSLPGPSAPGKPVLRAPRRGLQESQITSIAAELVEKSGRTK